MASQIVSSSLSYKTSASRPNDYPGPFKFSINDLRFWVWAFDQFVGDVRDLIPQYDDQGLPDQLDLDRLDLILQDEFEKDLEHQQYWWMYFDRAAEAIPLLESDGPYNYKYPNQGRLDKEGYETIRKYNESEAYINLVADNVERKMGYLDGVKPSFYAEAIDPKKEEAIRSLNYWVKDIKDNVNMDLSYNKFKWDGISFGSGVVRFGHGVDMNSPDFALFRNLVKNRSFLTPEEMDKYERVFEYHQIEHIPTFHVVRYRGAAGPQSISFTNPIHRQVSYIEHMTVAEARMHYPEYANKIHEGVADDIFRLSPYLALTQDNLSDMVTVYHHRIRFPVIEHMNIPIGYPGQTHMEVIKRSKPRYAIGYITRIHDAGIVDMNIDYYDHNQFDLVQWVDFASAKHSCGIGMVKFGRDAAIVHNKLHNAGLQYFGRQLKPGGFYLKGLLNGEDLKKLSKGGWVEVDKSSLPFNLRDAKLGELIQFGKQPEFPTAYAQFMQLESNAVDRSMRTTGAFRGQRTGYSGKQQQIASQDSAMMHSNSISTLNFNSKEMGNLLFNNIVQFDSDREITFTRKNENGDQETFVLNKPGIPYQTWDPYNGYQTVATEIKNNLATLDFAIRIYPSSIVPDKPVEKADFFIQMLQFIDQYIQTPHGRILLRNFSNEGMRIPGLSKSLDEMDNLDKEQRKLQAQLAQQAQQYEHFKDSRQFAKDKAEIDQNLLRLMQKFTSDLMNGNPETLKLILSGQYPNLQRDLMQAINQLMSVPGNIPQAGNMQPPGPMSMNQLSSGTGPQGPQPNMPTFNNQNS